MRSEIEVAARVESLAEIRAFIERACRGAGADAASCFDLKLAVDEACSNIIAHGYAGWPEGGIRIACDSSSDAVRVTIVDGGRAFDPSAVAPADVASDWKDRPLGGLGWHLIRRSVDDVDYGPDPSGGNRLTLVKKKGGRWTSG